MEEEVFVDFSHILRPILQQLLPEELDEQADVGGVSQSAAVKTILKDFESINSDNVLNIVDSSTKQLFEKEQSTLLGENISTLVSNWPPTISTKNPKINSLIIFIIRLLKKSSNPNLILRWISSLLIPKFSSEQSSVFSSTIKCISLAKYEDKECWAIYESNENFSLIESLPDLKFNRLKHAKLLDITTTETHVTVKIEPDENISFEPFTTKHIKLWSVAKEKPVKFVDFLTNQTQIYPKKLTLAMFNALTSFDSYLVRAILMSADNETYSQLASYMFRINLYHGRPQLFIQTIISMEIDNAKRPDSLFTLNSPNTLFLQNLCQNYLRYYFDNFISKILLYIDKSGELYLNKPEKFKKEVVQIKYFSVIKYLLASLEGIPDEIKMIAHIIKMYTAIKYNNANIILRAVASFFINCILKPTFLYPTAFDPGMNIKHERNMKHFVTLLEVAFQLQLMEYHNISFMFLDEYLKYHYQIHIEIFLYELSSIDHIPYFPQTTKTVVTIGINQILNYITNNTEKISKDLETLTNSNKMTMTPIHWNLCAMVIHSFPWNSDTARLQLKQEYLHNEHVSLPQPISLPLSSNFAPSYETYSLDEYKSENRKDLPPAPPLPPMLFREPVDEGNGYTEEGTPNTLDPGPATPFKAKVSSSKKRPKLKTPLRNAGEDDFIAIAGEVKKSKKMATVDNQDCSDIVPVRKIRSKKKRTTVKTVDK